MLSTEEVAAPASGVVPANESEADDNFGVFLDFLGEDECATSVCKDEVSATREDAHMTSDAPSPLLVPVASQALKETESSAVTSTRELRLSNMGGKATKSPGVRQRHSANGGTGLPQRRTDEVAGSTNSASKKAASFGYEHVQRCDDENSAASNATSRRRTTLRKVPGKIGRSIIKSLRRRTHDDSHSSVVPPSTILELESKPGHLPTSRVVGFGIDQKPSSAIREESRPAKESSHSRMSVLRRESLDVKSLTMGLDADSANFLDWQAQAKCQEWLRLFSRRDPRACIKTFFDDVARHGADSIEEENGFQPELLSPLLAMFQRSSVFSVWRPTSIDSIRKMMTGQGTGKGLDIKGKSAKKGKLSAYVPFVQIHEDRHKKKIRSLPPCGGIRIFYRKYEARDKAHKILSEILKDMVEKANTALACLLESDKISKDDIAQDDVSVAQQILASFHSLDMKGLLSGEEKEQVAIVTEWSMENPSIAVINDYTPKCYGLDLPKRLFWEGYVMRAKDITREPGSVYDTGRPSQPSFQDMNFSSIKDDCEEPRAVVWQYTDPYLPPSEPDPDPMMPQTLLMAYEEHRRVMPVVSDFDCFMLGTRGVHFRTPLPEEQVKLVHSMLVDIEKILEDCSQGRTKNWTQSWINSMKHHKKQVTMPKYGFGDPKSYAIMKYAVQRLQESGAIRHGAGILSDLITIIPIVFLSSSHAHALLLLFFLAS